MTGTWRKEYVYYKKSDFATHDKPKFWIWKYSSGELGGSITEFGDVSFLRRDEEGRIWNTPFGGIKNWTDSMLDRAKDFVEKTVDVDNDKYYDVYADHFIMNDDA